MDNQEDLKRVTVIVPSYNEGSRIGYVLDALTKNQEFYEVIVVDDGSTDETADVVARYPVTYVKNEYNMGKGRAMDRGVSLAKTDVILFIDADIIGLNQRVLEAIVEPVLNGTMDMFVAMRGRKIFFFRFIFLFIAVLGGERAITKKLWNMIPDTYKQGYEIESALNFYALHYGKGFSYEVFNEIHQTSKEKKFGLWEGSKRRWKMLGKILWARLILQTKVLPKSVKVKRLSVIAVLQGMLGSCIGVLMLLAVYFGPRQFILKIFAKELIEDPVAPFVHLLLKIAALVSVNILLFIAIVITLGNLVILILAIRRFLMLTE